MVVNPIASWSGAFKLLRSQALKGVTDNVKYYKKGRGIGKDIAETGVDMLYHQGLPWLAKKLIEMGRYYGSEALRNKKLQKKVIDYGMEKAKPYIHEVRSKALDKLSTKIRPNKKYKTDRKDLDGAGIDIHKAIGK